MAEADYDLSTHRSKGLDAVPPGGFDYVITMGCGDECPFIEAKVHDDWDIPNPKNMPPEEFREVRDLIESRIKALIGRDG
jgi:protein-tyrosine-phosphatase